MKSHRFAALALSLTMVLSLLCAGVVSAEGVDIIDVLVNGKTAQAFSEGAVTGDDLNSILLAGINAQSAMNSQPWHFSVITDSETLSLLSGGMGGQPGGQPDGQLPSGDNDTAGQPPAGAPDGSSGTPAGGGAAKVGMADAAVAIVISCSSTLRWNSFDAGGACDRMSVMALALGYSTKIVAGPCDVINASEEYRALCGIPDDMEAIAVLLIGNTQDTADALSTATIRNALEDVVTFVSK